MTKKIKVTLVKSLIGRLANHKACAQVLKLNKIGKTVEISDTPENRGIVNRISYLLKIEE